MGFQVYRSTNNNKSFGKKDTTSVDKDVIYKGELIIGVAVTVGLDAENKKYISGIQFRKIKKDNLGFINFYY